MKHLLAVNESGAPQFNVRDAILAYSKTETAASMNLSFELGNVRTLLTLYDDESKRISKNQLAKFEILKRAGIILAITGWETFIEAILTAQFQRRLAAASTPSEIQSAFNSVARAWLEGDHFSKPKPPDVARWTGAGWKALVNDRFMHDITDLNTPNCANIRRLFEKYIEIDVTKHWKWQKVSPKLACQRLDELIALRGDIVHHSRNYVSESKAKALRRQVVQAVSLVGHLAKCTVVALKEPELAMWFDK